MQNHAVCYLNEIQASKMMCAHLHTRKLIVTPSRTRFYVEVKNCHQLTLAEMGF